MTILNITQSNFEEVVLQAQKPVLLDFWATWCGPCKMIAPYVEQIAQEREDILVGKVDVDQESVLAARFGITSIPTLILMENGKPVRTVMGYRPKADILKQLGL